MPNAERDRDLESIHQARQLGRAAVAAQQQIEGFSQEQIERICSESIHLDRLAMVKEVEVDRERGPDARRIDWGGNRDVPATRNSKSHGMFTDRKIGEDLLGKRIGRWRIDRNEIRSIDVVEVEQGRSEARVVIDLEVRSVENLGFYRKYSTSEGRLRLSYELIADEWSIVDIQDLSFKISQRRGN